jgi:hypothetical protein
MEGVFGVRSTIISQLTSHIVGGLYPKIGELHPKWNWMEMEGWQNASTAYLMRKAARFGIKAFFSWVFRKNKPRDGEHRDV